MKRLIGFTLAIFWVFTSIGQDFSNPLAKQPHKDEIQYFMNADKRVVPPTVDYVYKRVAKRERRKDPWTIVDYYDNGNVQLKTFSVHADPISTEYQDSYVEFFLEGDSFIVQNYRTNYKHGRYVKYFSNGKIEEKGSYQKGRLQGGWKAFYKNGEPKEQGEYRDFKRYGKWKFYSEKGYMVKSGSFENGVENGEWKEYHENGKIKSMMTYVEGKLQGEMKTFHPTGELASTLNYTDGMASGPLVEYHRNGNVAVQKTFDDGMVVGSYLELAENGDTVVSGELLENVPNGHWKFKNADLVTVREEAYVAGKMMKAIDFYSHGQQRMITKNTSNGLVYQCFTDEGEEQPCTHKYSSPEYTGTNLAKDIVGEIDPPVDQRYNARMYISFTINENGKVENASILESANTYLDNEVIKQVESTVWTPGWKGDSKGSFDAELMVRFNMDGTKNVGLSDFSINSSIQDQRWAYRYTTMGMDPQFPDGEEAMFKFISSNLVYPEFAKEESLSGTCYVRFKINRSGMISNATILKSAHPALDYEAIKVVESMPSWSPASIDGKPISTFNNIPFRFTLN